jgi:hypothetical protein
VEKKEKEPKKKEWGGLMETDDAVEKQRTVSHSILQNAAAFRTVSTGPAAINQQTDKTTKPDTSLATKTGHFHLLPTAPRSGARA